MSEDKAGVPVEEQIPLRKGQRLEATLESFSDVGFSFGRGHGFRGVGGTG